MKSVQYSDDSPSTYKIGDTTTVFKVSLINDEETVDLSTAESIEVKVADATRQFIKSFEATADNNVIEINFNNLLGQIPSGLYLYEINVNFSNGDVAIYPDTKPMAFQVYGNLEDGAKSISFISAGEWENRFSELQNNVNTAVDTVNNQADSVEQGLSKIDTATQNAVSATDNANDIVATVKSDLANGAFNGPKGDQGIQGIQGIQGEKGDKGATGEQGIQGVQGAKGDTGEQGIQGTKGDKGDPGDTGNGISSIVTTYANSASGTVAPSLTLTDGNGVTTSNPVWQSTIPSFDTNNPFLWSNQHISYTDGTSSDFQMVSNLSNATAQQALSQVQGMNLGYYLKTNLIVGSTNTNGYYIDSSGNMVLVNNGFFQFVSDYIPVASSTSYIVTIQKGTSGNVRFAEYDSNKNFIVRQLGNTQTTYTFKTSANTSYVRLSPDCIDSGYYRNPIKMEIGTVATPWCPSPSEILTTANYNKLVAAIVALGGSV